MNIYYNYYESVIGIIQLASNEESIISISFVEKKTEKTSNNNIIKEATKQIDEYFKAKRKKIQVKYEIKGTEFQEKIWKRVIQIPYGQTITYEEVAKSTNSPKAMRAVGNANKKNPLLILIPCHRVISKNGKESGYIGGKSRKNWLLEFESRNLHLEEKNDTSHRISEKIW